MGLGEMKHRLFLVALCLCFWGQTFAEKIKLADASASASVVELAAKDAYGIEVAFRPVTALDEVTNREMTEVIGQFYAEEALSSFLHSVKVIRFSRVKVDWKEESAPKVCVVYQVPSGAIFDAPRKEVEVREEVVGKKNPDVKKLSSTSASTVFQDFRSTCFRDLRIAEAVYAEESAKVKGKESAAELKGKMRGAFVALRKKVEADDNLFRAEKKELLEQVEKVERYLTKELEGGGESAAEDEEEAALPIVEAVFQKPFGTLLKTDLILLTHGGARLIEMKDGSIAVISVGWARAESDDRVEIAEMRASGALGKLKAGEEVKMENKAENVYTRSISTGDGEQEKKNYKRLSKTTLNSIDFHKSGETVGTWFSKDKKKFFIAKGMIIRPKAER